MSEPAATRLPVWLIASVILNALLIGLLIGSGFGRGKPPPVPRGGETAVIRGLEQSIPVENRPEVRRAFREALMNSREARRDLRQARQRLNQVLTDSDYDREAVLEAFQNLREAEAGSKVAIQEELATQFGQLSVEQRREILRAMSERSRKRLQTFREREGRLRPEGAPPPVED